jgi:predicted nucleotidyltransferase
MIPAHIHQEIMRRLSLAEQEHGVRILLAIESGSRAWGFASENSDFDVRFIYAHPADWYLAVDLEERPDVIEYGIVDDIDLNGWDLRKALCLFWKTNPTFIEWIQSPIRYLDRGPFTTLVRQLLPTVYSPERGIYHYRSMAKTNYRGHFDGELVSLKKYFYVLRPLLSVQWIERYSTPPPIEFEKLLHLQNSNTKLISDIQALLEKKRSSTELGMADPVPSLNAFIESELYRLENANVETHPRPEVITALNTLFQTVIRH